jgi:MBG domain-containing protein/List-Bact-rpt repeat protein/Regulator of Chromosome Condensation (RCC1) repeat protein/Big-like domain-containing protein
MKTHPGNLLALTLVVLAFNFFPLISANAVPPGTVVAWGDNSAVPTGLSNVVAIAAGAGFDTVALLTNGTVVAWGPEDNYGVTNVPAGLSGVTAIAAGLDDIVVLKSSGTVVAWGDNTDGELNIPTGLSNVVAIAAGFYHTVALRSNGTVVVWGLNNAGQTTVPMGLSNVVAIAAGAEHTVALQNNGMVVAWGNNGDGQTTVPIGLSNVVSIAAGVWDTVALQRNGTVVAWGDNGDGEPNIPVPVGLSNVVAIAAGIDWTVALQANGTVVEWGYNDFGQTNVPTGLSNVVAVAAGNYETVALTGKGTAIVTLSNLSQIYDGTAKGISVTTAPSGLTVNVSYNGSANVPTNAGSYVVIGTINDPNYQGSVTNTLVISKVTETVTLGNLSQIYDGTAKSVFVMTAPLILPVSLIYNGLTNAPISAGSYTVIGTINNNSNYFASSVTNTLVIGKATGTVTLGNLSQIFDGTAKAVSVTTTPPSLTVNVTYNGSGNAPTNAGSYTVVGTINNQNYQGSATNTLVISAPSIFLPVKQSGVAFTFTWNAIPGQTYLVEYKNTLSQPTWSILGGAIIATNSIATAFDIIAPAFSERFYRDQLLVNNGNMLLPVVTITSPTVNQQLTNAVFTVSGTANDNTGVAAVFYQLNSQRWATAATTNGWTNWTANATLIHGTNSVRAYAVNTSGNISATNNVSFQSSASQNSPTLLLFQPLPHAQVGQFYSQLVGQGTGGTPPYYFSLETGSGFPPIGIIMDLNGNLSGTPSVAGTYNFGVCVVDLVGEQDCETATLIVDPALQLSITTTGSGTGTVTANPPGPAYTNGTVVTLTATPGSGSTFNGWSGDASGTASSVQITMNGNKSVTAEFDGSNPAWNGTWNSTQSFVSSDGSCSQNVTASISLVLSVSGGTVSGSGTENGIPCFNADCSVDSYPTITGPVSGSVSGNTISVNFSGVANGGACDGQSVGTSFTATMINSTTISGTTPSGRAFTYTKQ